MKKLVCSLLVVSFLAVGCGKNGTINVGELNLIRGVITSLVPSTANTAKTLDLSNLSTLLTNIATSGQSSGQLSATQAANLLDPTNQSVLQNILQLVQGGTAAVQQNAASSLMTAVGGNKAGLGPKLAGILTILQEVAPVIATIDPAIAPYIEVALAILPLVEGFFGGSSAAVAAH